MEISEEIEKELDRQICQYTNMTEFTRPLREDTQKIIDILGGDLKVNLTHRVDTVHHYIILLLIKKTIIKKGGGQMNNKDINTGFKINIKYSCLQCSLKNIVLEVPARGDEDVVTWMQNSVGSNIKKDHAMRHPECPAESAQEVMIPMTGTDKIGGPTIN